MTRIDTTVPPGMPEVCTGSCAELIADWLLALPDVAETCDDVELPPRRFGSPRVRSSSAR